MTGRGSHSGARCESKPVSLSENRWIQVDDHIEKTGKKRSKIIDEALEAYFRRIKLQEVDVCLRKLKDQGEGK